MKQATAEAIVEAGKEVDVQLQLREDYSGRGMYGKTTAAIVGDNQSEFIYALVTAAFKLGQDANSAAEGFLEDCEGIAFDSMGKGIVAY